MTALAWTPALALDQPEMDQTHHEFVALLAQAHDALAGDDAPLVAVWQQLVDHTVEHFAQEERWMQATGFAPQNCHSMQHQAVLQVMQECARRARDEADLEPLRLAVGELALWFPQHAQQMDAALAQHMAACGFDPARPQAAQPPSPRPEAAAITGCGSARCG